MQFNIKPLREKKKMSQDELSEKTGISRTIISGLESGSIKNTTALTLKKIADALECKVADLFFENDV